MQKKSGSGRNFSKRGKKVSGADDQQERLIKIGWVIGFVDGEGCFSIGFVRQNDRMKRKGYKTGYQVRTAKNPGMT